MFGVFLDTETNGLNSQVHRILEIALQIVDLSTGEKKDSFQAVLSQTKEQWNKSDQESLRVNGFTWDETQKGVSPRAVSQQIIDLFSKWGIRRKQAVFICQNPSFDRAFFSQLIDPATQELMSWPYHWLDLASMYWALSIDRFKREKGELPWNTGYSKDQIAAHFQLPEEAKPHRAMNGVSHLLLCYQAVVGFPQKR